MKTKRRFLCLALMCAVTLSAEETQKFQIARGSRPASTIIIGEKASHAALFAAKELREHIRKITGADIPVAFDTDRIEGNRILVGDSKETRRLGFSNDTFKSQEFMIKPFPGTIVLMGRDKTSSPPSRFDCAGEIELCEGNLGGKALVFKNGALRINDCDFTDEKGSMECLVYLPDNANGNIMTISGVGYHHGISCVNGKLVYKVREVFPEEYGGRGLDAVSRIESSQIIKGWRRILSTHDAYKRKLNLFVDGQKIGETEYFRTYIGNGASLHLGGYYVDYGSCYDKQAYPCVINKSIWAENSFNGKIEEALISGEPREAASGYMRLPVKGSDLCARMGVNNDLCADFSGKKQDTPPPFSYDEQGTVYAAHEFLEKFCGVRWYGPTELETVCPQEESLTVCVNNIKRSPALRHRDASGKNLRSSLSNYILFNRPGLRDWSLFMSRLKAGGDRFMANHSYTGYYNRFLNTKSPRFEELKQEIWAQRKNQPTDTFYRQICYSNREAFNQIVKDGREYFDGGILNYRTIAAGDYYSVSPSDMQYFCECEQCRRGIADIPSGSMRDCGLHSNYVFNFVNKVAEELKKTHPDKHVSTIAYQTYLTPPEHVSLAPDVAVMICTDFQALYRPGVRKRVMTVYNKWLEEARGSGRPLYVFPYYLYPETYATERQGRKHYAFPVFTPHLIVETHRMFARDGVKGFQNCGAPRQLDFYLMYKTADDMTVDADSVISEFFRYYYGGAEKPMREFFEEIETAVSDPANFPDQNSYTFFESTSWGALGSEARMRKLGECIERAEKNASTPETKQRVILFKDGIWQYMLKGKEDFQRKLLACSNDPHEAQKMLETIDKMRKTRPPSVTVPYLKPGSAAGTDWNKAGQLENWRKINGFPAQNKNIFMQIAHDGKNLLLRVADSQKDMTLKSAAGNVWGGDVFEFFFAPARNSLPYHQLAVSPNERSKTLLYPDNVPGVFDWHAEARIKSETGKAGLWVLEISIPLSRLVPYGVKPGDVFYANFYRDDGKGGLFAWSPNFVDSFHALNRLGQFTLAPVN